MKDNLNQANWLRHSDLFHLSPSNIGTDEIESLSAFSRRLADAHSMDALDLYRYIFSRDDFQAKPFIFHNVTRLLDGISHHTERCISIFEQLTLQTDLKQLTFLRWADRFSILPLLRMKAAWCGNCYQEWQDTGQTISNPLKWRLNIYDFCEHHNRPLSSHCPFADCGKEFHNLPGSGGLGFCPYCNRWLGSSETASKNEDSHAARIRSEFLSSFLFIDFPQSMSSSSLTKSALLLTQEKTGLAKNALFTALKTSPKNFIGYEAGVSKLSLKLLCDLVVFAELQAHELLEIHEELIRKHDRTDMPSSSTILRGKAHAGLRAALEEAASSLILPPPTVNKIAKAHNVQAPTLEKIAPELCKKITERVQNYRKTQFKADLEAFLKNELKVTDRPPMRIIEIAEYFGLESSDAIHHSFPRLRTQIVKRWNSYHGITKDDQLQKAKLYLENLLLSNADPCPSIFQIADELDLMKHFLEWNFGDLLEKIVLLRTANFEALLRTVELRLRQSLKQAKPDSLDTIAEELLIPRAFFMSILLSWRKLSPTKSRNMIINVL